MESSSSPDPKTTSDILSRCMSLLSQCIPSNWSTFKVTDEYPYWDVSPDGQLGMRSPDGMEALLVIEAKRILERRDVAAVTQQLSRLTQFRQNTIGLVVARYLAPSVREALMKEGLSFADATGNVHVNISRPGLFISCQGANRDPWRGPGRPRGTLKGAPAAKIVRALVDFPSAPWNIRELIAVSGVSTGAAYRVVEHLEREALIERDANGKIVAREWRPLLRAWSKDYGFSRSSRVTSYIDPRGLPSMLGKVSKSNGINYAVTGTVAAAEWAPYAPARSVLIYVEDAEIAAATWGLRPSEAGTNVLLAEPESDVVFQRRLTTVDGIEIAAPAQVAVDLMTGPGRNPSEAEELMDWMERNEPSWRK